MRMTLAALGTSVVLLSSAPVQADQIVSFGQLGTLNTFFALNNGDGTTTLSASAGVSITNIVSGATDPNAVFEFEADSVEAATLLGGAIITQQFAGTFSLHNQANTLQYLFGDFGAALMLGGDGGTGALFTSNTAGLAPLHLFTDLPVTLVNPESFSLSLSNVSPPLGIVGGTIDTFSASFTGTADAGVQQDAPIPEPGSLLLLGSGLLGVVGAARRRRHADC